MPCTAQRPVRVAVRLASIVDTWWRRSWTLTLAGILTRDRSGEKAMDGDSSRGMDHHHWTEPGVGGGAPAEDPFLTPADPSSTPAAGPPPGAPTPWTPPPAYGATPARETPPPPGAPPSRP